MLFVSNIKLFMLNVQHEQNSYYNENVLVKYAGRIHQRLVRTLQEQKLF